MENLSGLSKLDFMYNKVYGDAGISAANTVSIGKVLPTPVTTPIAIPAAMAGVKLPANSNDTGDSMLLFIVLIGATAVTVYLIYDWQKRRQAERYKL